MVGRRRRRKRVGNYFETLSYWTLASFSFLQPLLLLLFLLFLVLLLLLHLSCKLLLLFSSSCRCRLQFQLLPIGKLLCRFVEIFEETSSYFKIKSLHNSTI